jgi:hypothetical protein
MLRRRSCKFDVVSMFRLLANHEQRREPKGSGGNGGVPMRLQSMLPSALVVCVHCADQAGAHTKATVASSWPPVAQQR